MRSSALLLLLALLAPGPALAASDRAGAGIIAADRAFAALAQTHGEWTAFRAAAAPHAEMFVPRRVEIESFGGGRPDPPVATRWHPQHAWLSCDGTAGLTFGRWSVPGTRQHGWYEAVWVQRRSGGYQLLLRRGGTNPRRLFSRPGPAGVRAQCSGTPGLPISAPPEGTDLKIGASRDQTLIWSSAVDPAGAVTITAARWDGGRHVPILADTAPPPNAR